jgi:endonuclease/exonuclease/phosphatase family metal-dependent hydrolase
MRIVTWKMNHCFKPARLEVAWEKLSEWRPAFALLQETRLPPVVAAAGGRVVYDPLDPPRRGEWGTAIWSPVTPLRRLDSPRSHSGACVVAEVEADAGPVTLISLYGLLEPLLGTEYSITTLHRLLSDLTVYLEEPRRQGRIILGGDLNANVAWDKRQRGPTHRLLFDRIEAFGLRSVLPHGEGDPQTPTWHRQGARIRQLDYLFVSQEIEIGPGGWTEWNDDLADLSDHSPLWVELSSLDATGCR